MNKMSKGGMHKMPGGKMMKDSAMKKMAKGGMAMSGVLEGGKMDAYGSDAAGPTATTLTQNVKKSVTGDRVQVRGVGAARARSAKIY